MRRGVTKGLEPLSNCEPSIEGLAQEVVHPFAWGEDVADLVAALTFVGADLDFHLARLPSEVITSCGRLEGAHDVLRIDSGNRTLHAGKAFVDQRSEVVEGSFLALRVPDLEMPCEHRVVGTL